jgi:hypothetical protein
MNASHGGQAKNDTLDAQKMAVLLRGGMLPQASGSPAARRAPRDRLRRRLHLTRNRAALLTHGQQTNGPYNLPALGPKIAYQANRPGGAARVPDPAVRKRVAGALALLDCYAQVLREVEWTIGQTAKQHDAQTFYRRQAVPGSGKMLSLVLRDESHDSRRFPRVQAFVASCRRVTCAQASAGKRYGSAGTKIGHASLQWACSDAAV